MSTIPLPSSRLLIGPALSGKTRAIRDILIALVNNHGVKPSEILLLCPTPHQAVTFDLALNTELPEHNIHVTTLTAWSLNLVRTLEAQSPDTPPLSLYPPHLFSSLYAEIKTLNPKLTPDTYSQWLAHNHILSPQTLFDYVLGHLSHPAIQKRLPKYVFSLDIHHTDHDICWKLLQRLTQDRPSWLSIDPFGTTTHLDSQNAIQTYFSHLAPYSMPEFKGPKWVKTQLSAFNWDVTPYAIHTPEPHFTPLGCPAKTPQEALQWTANTLQDLHFNKGIALDEIAVITHEDGSQLTTILDQAHLPSRNIAEDHPLRHPQLQKIMGYLQCIYNPNDPAGRLALSDADEKTDLIANITLACNQGATLATWKSCPEPALLTQLRTEYFSKQTALPILILKLVAGFQETESIPESDETNSVVDFLLELSEIYHHNLTHVLDHLHTTAIWEDTQQWTAEPHRKITIIPHTLVNALHTFSPVSVIIIIAPHDLSSLSPKLLYTTLTQRNAFWGLSTASAAQNQPEWLTHMLETLPLKAPDLTLTPLTPNQKVQHPEWGIGKILKIEGTGPRQTIQIQFGDTQKTIMRQYAPWLTTVL